jgi:hypothetical protein
LTTWPPIKNERLHSRLLMGDDEFAALSLKLGRRLGGREFSPEDYERAISYPWERPRDSFWMEDGAVEILGAADHPAAGREQRYPLITFGSNGAPGVLAAKLSVLAEDERDVLVLAGELNGFDVVHSAHVALYGALPATIVRSPGTSVRAGLIMATAAQFEALTMTEFNYRLARVDGAAFAADLDVPAPADVFIYVSRAGSFSIGGESVGLEAVPSRGRSIATLSQPAVLDAAAAVTIGEGASGVDVVQKTIEDYAWSVDVARPALAATTNPFNPDDWQLLPG